MPDSGEGVCKLDEYRGANNWKGLIPSVTEPRVWDEGFRSFLLKCVACSKNGPFVLLSFVFFSRACSGSKLAACPVSPISSSLLKCVWR